MDITVGVITPYRRMFRIWMQDNAKPEEIYVHISRIDHVRGRVFNRIEKQIDWHLVDPDVCFAAEARIRKPALPGTHT